MINNKKLLRQRFCKDYNLPINVYGDEVFQYYMDLYDFFPKKVYDDIVKTIEEKYKGSVELWLDYCGGVRDSAINEILSSTEYSWFNSIDITTFDIPPICGERMCYNGNTDGKHFISIDLRKANFQALKYVGVLKDNTYEDFIKRHGGDDYIANSKYLRQVIFGKLNPSRQIKVEKYLMYKAYESIKHIVDAEELVLYSFNSDEIIFEVPNELHNVLTHLTIDRLITELKDIISTEVNIDVRVEYIEVNKLHIKNSNGTQIDAFERLNYITNEVTLKKASTTFFPQIYKLWKGKDINEKDRTFYFEGQLAIFNEPLILDKNDI